ncbi:MAG: hypothetical protein EHM43_11665 [Ignavibacteriae bacterium]|nr:MAG: hypothetical protein EHM43_11665 [Ignavibacteriota bacterium]
MNNAEHEPLISRVEPMPVRVTRSEQKYDPSTQRWVEPLPVDDSVRFTTAEKLSMRVDAAWQTTKFVGVITPHVLSIIWSYMMSNSAKLAAAIAGLIVAVLSFFNVIIPESLLPYITSGVALLIGWLIPAPGAKKEDKAGE